MAIDARINVPFLPQEGITSQILAAIQAANEEHYRNQELTQQKAQLAQQGQIAQAQIQNEQQQIAIRKRAQDLAEQGWPSELALRQANIDATNAQTQLATLGVAQKQQMIDALAPGNTTSGAPAAPANIPTAPVGPTAPSTNTTGAPPAPGPPPPNPTGGMSAADFVSQNIPPHLAPQAHQILGPLGNLSQDEQSRVAAAAAEGPAAMFKAGNVSGYYEPLGNAVKDILSKRGAPDPISDFEKASFLESPGAQASIQARIQDPRTKPEEVPVLQRLNAQANAAQANKIAMKERELKAEQAAKQGDPNAAAAMMVNHELTLNDLKTRGSTPDFILKTTQAAQKLDPNYNVAVADQQAKVAGSSAHQAFFGNSRSLVEPGGTIDQLLKQAQSIPSSDYPKANKLADWAELNTGKGPLAGYIATVVGVSDDLAKVMGGGQGSDSSRALVESLVKPDASPAQRQASANAIKAMVSSQMKGRVGNNPFMRQYVEDLPGFEPGGALSQNPKTPAAAAPPSPPAGATMRVPGSDGKLHWSDGKTDLGPAE